MLPAELESIDRTATVRAKEPVQVMVFEPTYFRPLLIENPTAAVTLLEGLFAG